MPIAKPLLALALLCASLQTQAQARESCSYSVTMDISLEPEVLRLSGRRSEWRIEDQRLYRDGEEVSLTADQRRLLADYRQQMRDLVPQVSSLAMQGARLGADGAMLALSTLASEERRPAVEEHRQRLDAALARLQERLDGRHLYGQRFGDSKFEHEFEAELEAAAEAAARDAAGAVLSTMWDALFDPKGLEARTERIGREVEARIESQADEVGRQAEKLCPAMARLDALETELGQFDAISSEHGGKPVRGSRRAGRSVITL